MNEVSEASQRAANRSMPTTAVIPVLAYPDVRQAVEWLCRCLGFSERLRIGDHRAQLCFGDGAIVVTGKRANDQPAQPIEIMVRVANVDSHYQDAVGCGVKVLNPPTDYPYGERQYTLEDIGGYTWTISQTVTDVDPGSWGGLLLDK